MLVTYYFNAPEIDLRRAKATGKRPGRYFGGITLTITLFHFCIFDLIHYIRI